MFHKKAMMDDLFDFLFTVMAIFFLLLFVSAVMSGSLEKKNEQAVEKARRTAGMDELMMQQRMRFALNQPVNWERVEREQRYIEIFGYVPGVGRSKENYVVGEYSAQSNS